MQRYRPPRARLTAVRLTEREFQELHNLARVCELTVSDVLRDGVKLIREQRQAVVSETPSDARTGT
jgi:hypothetical protein